MEQRNSHCNLIVKTLFLKFQVKNNWTIQKKVLVVKNVNLPNTIDNKRIGGLYEILSSYNNIAHHGADMFPSIYCW